MQQERGKRKVRIGIVVADKMDKTRVVAVHWSSRHPLYRRRVRRMTKFTAHDELNETRQGDQVRISETRPLSKTKRWRIIEVLARGEQVEVKPVEVDQTLMHELEHKPEEPVAEIEEAPSAEVAVAEEAPPTEEAAVAAKPRTKAKATIGAKPKAPRKKAAPKATGKTSAEAEEPAQVEETPENGEQKE